MGYFSSKKFLLFLPVAFLAFITGCSQSNSGDFTLGFPVSFTHLSFRGLTIFDFSVLGLLFNATLILLIGYLFTRYSLTQRGLTNFLIFFGIHTLIYEIATLGLLFISSADTFPGEYIENTVILISGLIGIFPLVTSGFILGILGANLNNSWDQLLRSSYLVSGVLTSFMCLVLLQFRRDPRKIDFFLCYIASLLILDLITYLITHFSGLSR